MKSPEICVLREAVQKAQETADKAVEAASSVSQPSHCTQKAQKTGDDASETARTAHEKANDAHYGSVGDSVLVRKIGDISEFCNAMPLGGKGLA